MNDDTLRSWVPTFDPTCDDLGLDTSDFVIHGYR